MQTPISDRLEYEPFNDSHEAYYMGWVTNPQIMRYISGAPLTEGAGRIRFQKALALATELDGGGYFLVRMDGRALGFCKLQLFEPKVLEVGYIVSTEFQKQGYASEMVQALLKYTEAQFPDYQIMALVDPENQSSVNVLQKNGFIYLKTIEKNGFTSDYYQLVST